MSSGKKNPDRVPGEQSSKQSDDKSPGGDERGDLASVSWEEVIHHSGQPANGGRSRSDVFERKDLLKSNKHEAGRKQKTDDQ